METALLGGLSCPYGRDQLQGYTGGQAELAAGALQPSHPPAGLFAQPLCKSFHDPASRLGSFHSAPFGWSKKATRPPRLKSWGNPFCL